MRAHARLWVDARARSPSCGQGTDTVMTITCQEQVKSSYMSELTLSVQAIYERGLSLICKLNGYCHSIMECILSCHSNTNVLQTHSAAPERGMELPGCGLAGGHAPGDEQRRGPLQGLLSQRRLPHGHGPHRLDRRSSCVAALRGCCVAAADGRHAPGNAAAAGALHVALATTGVVREHGHAHDHVLHLRRWRAHLRTCSTLQPHCGAFLAWSCIRQWAP